MMTLASMTLLAVMMRTLNQQPTIRGQGQDLNPQGQAPPIALGQGHDQVPARQVQDLGQDPETERDENILNLGQGQGHETDVAVHLLTRGHGTAPEVAEINTPGGRDPEFLNLASYQTQ